MNKYDTYLQLEDKPTAFNSLSIPLFVGSGVFSYIKTKHVYHIDWKQDCIPWGTGSECQLTMWCVCVCVAVSSPAHQLHSTFHLLNPRPIDASGHLLGAKQLMENLLRNTNIYTSHQRAVMQSWGRCRVNELIWYHCCWMPLAYLPRNHHHCWLSCICWFGIALLTLRHYMGLAYWLISRVPWSVWDTKDCNIPS